MENTTLIATKATTTVTSATATTQSATATTQSATALPLSATAKKAIAVDPEMRLSKHFVLREFTLSGTAIRYGIDNTPSATEVERLRVLCDNVLEPLRRRFGVLRITSGYRSERVNRLVGGSATSQHRLGEAADIHVSSLEVARKMCAYAKEHIDYDQLIIESVKKSGARWIHVSYRKGANRKEFFTINK